MNRAAFAVLVALAITACGGPTEPAATALVFGDVFEPGGMTSKKTTNSGLRVVAEGGDGTETPCRIGWKINAPINEQADFSYGCPNLPHGEYMIRASHDAFPGYEDAEGATIPRAALPINLQLRARR